MRIKSPYPKLLALVMAGLAATSLRAADTFFDLDTDPNSDPNFRIVGNHQSFSWVSTGGNPDTGGYLSIADGNITGQNLVVVFPDIDGGYPIKAFHLTADVRAGNSGNGDGRPADGFSISYCREGDKVLVNATNGVAGGAAGGDSDAQTTDPNGSGDLENGTKSGVAILFDAWQGNRLPDTGPGGTPGPDVEGIAVRVDDKTLLQLDMVADRNGNCYSPTNAACEAGVCADFNTEQTGPWLNDGGTTSGLCWARLDVELTATKQVTVIWKGRTLVNHFQLANYPNHRGRLVLMGRTGGNAQNAHFDNIHLVTTPAIEATFDSLAFGPGLNQFHFVISDNAPSILTNVSQVILDGVNVTSSIVMTTNGNQKTGTYTQVPFFAPNSTHTVSITWQTTLGQTLSVSNQTFNVGNYLILSPALAVSASSIDLTKPGFFIQPYQTSAGNPNRNYWTDEQLEGLHGTNWIDFSAVPGATNNSEVAWDNVLDFANAGSGGQFPVDASWTTLGIPGPGLFSEDNSSLAACSYLYFPSAGLYNLGVNSDDGFRVSFNVNSHDMIGTEVAGLLFDGGRGIGANQNIGLIYVGTPGYYGVRLMFYNGGGGSGLEFYTTSTPASGVTSILVNDTNNPVSLRSYQISSAAPAYVSFAEPPMDDNAVLANMDLHYHITDSGTTVLPGAVSLTVNGVLRSPTVTKSGGVTDVALTHPASLWPIGTNTVNLSYTDSASATYDHIYTFIVQPYVTLPTNILTVVGSGFNPGFRMKAFQTPNTDILNGWQNNVSFAIQGAEGFYAGNEADLSIFTHGGEFWQSSVINFSQNSGGTVTDNGNFRSTDVPTPHPDAAAPGLPGAGVTTMDNDAFVARTFLEFPAAGLYVMGVNSDDGFRVGVGDRMGPGRSMLTILAPQSLAGDVLAMNQTRNFGGALPVPPIIRRAVLCDPPWPTAMPNNASALAGNIAICHRTPAGGVAAHTYWAQQAGAVAVVFVDQDDLGPTRQVGAFGTGSPTPTIPIVEIGYTPGTNLLAVATTNDSSPVILSVGDGSNPRLGEFDNGRGASDTIFGLFVPTAGVYPLTLWWENGGGDANCEWFTVNTVTGDKTLINDPGSSVKAWIQRTFPTGAHFNAPTMSGNNLTLSWTGEGELEFAYYVNGPWFQAVNQANPQTVPVSGPPNAGQTFYRVRSY